jgi:hypothetical protein
MKAALRRLVMSQARELAPHKIRVNAIAPGFIDNRLFPGERGERYDQFNIRAETEVLLGPGKPSDIACAAVYLASDEAPIPDRHLHPGRRRNAAPAYHRDLSITRYGVKMLFPYRATRAWCSPPDQYRGLRYI